jgi:hypothetical protein
LISLWHYIEDQIKIEQNLQQRRLQYTHASTDRYKYIRRSFRTRQIAKESRKSQLQMRSNTGGTYTCIS